jgi:hypothetical protein
VEFKNTGLGISPNTSSTTNYASVVQVTAGDMVGCYFSHVVFVAVSGGNIFNPLAKMYNPSNSTGGVPVFVDCAIPSFKYLLYPGGNFIRCGLSALAQGYLGSAVGALSFIGDTASTPVSILVANFSTGTQVALQDMTYAPNIPQVGVIFSVKSVALDGGLYLTAYPNVQGSQFGNLIGCTITNAGSKYIYMDGTYQSCVISPGKVVWGNSLCQNCILTPTANSTWVDGTGAPGGFGTTKYPKFYGCRFLAAMSLASAGTVDLNHCSLISTWGSPANLSYATSTLAAGYNVIAANTNWNSP